MGSSFPGGIRNVAVIGAGISGIAAAKSLSDAQFNVTVFERGSGVGGIWVYDERLPPEPSYPNIVPSTAEAIPSPPDDVANGSDKISEQSIEALQLRHAPPSPAYASLKNNIPTCLMSFRDQGWPAGTPDYTSHVIVLEYVRAFARHHNVERFIQFDTRVSRVQKLDLGWSVDTCTLRVVSGRLQYTTQNHHFDAIVVCCGHNSSPKVPDIRGLAELKQTWPRHIMHSKSYRHSDDIVGENIVLVGNGASAYDIAHGLSGRVQKLYQVNKVNSGYVPIEFMPAIVERVAEIAFVEDLTGSSAPADREHDANQRPTFRVHLIDGQILENVHSIVLCTGYVRSYPFLTQYHQDDAKADTANNTVLVTDGTMTHNLHKDIFYIPQPTLSFVGIPTGTTSLALHEYQALLIASTLSGQVQLPSEESMQTEYRARLGRKTPGRKMHNLQGEEVEYVQELVDCLNSDPQGAHVEGYSETWLAILDKRKAWLKEIFQNRNSSDARKPAGEDVLGICSSDSGSYLQS